MWPHFCLSSCRRAVSSEYGDIPITRAQHNEFREGCMLKTSKSAGTCMFLQIARMSSLISVVEAGLACEASIIPSPWQTQPVVDKGRRLWDSSSLPLAAPWLSGAGPKRLCNRIIVIRCVLRDQGEGGDI